MRVAGLTKSHRSEVSDELMVTVSVLGSAGESRDDDEGSVQTDHPNEIGQDRLFAPLLCGLDMCLAETEIEGAGEELLSAVEAPGLQKLLGANDTESFEELRTNDVLASVASRHRDIRDAGMVAPGEPSDQSRVLVVGMSAGVQRAGRRSQTLKELDETRRPQAVFGTNLGARAGRHREETDHQGDDDDERTPGSLHYDLPNEPIDSSLRPRRVAGGGAGQQGIWWGSS
jgi:hypothetical protein